MELEKYLTQVNNITDLFKQPGFLQVHCFCHQFNLNTKNLENLEVVKDVKFVINLIRGRYHKLKFVSYVKTLEKKNLINYNETRWISIAQSTKSLWDLYSDVINYFENNLAEQSINSENDWIAVLSDPSTKKNRRLIKIKTALDVLNNVQWKLKFCFLVDLLDYLKITITLLQGNHQSMFELIKIIIRYKNRLSDIDCRIKENNYLYFPTFLMKLNKEPNFELQKFCLDCILTLSIDITEGGADGQRFLEIDKYSWMYNLVVDPYNHLEKYNNYISFELYEEIKGVHEGHNLFEHSFLNPHKKLLRIFVLYLKTTEATSYDCEQIFSQLKLYKTEKRSRLTNENLLFQLTLIELKDFETISEFINLDFNDNIQNRIEKRNLYFSNFQLKDYLNNEVVNLFSLLD